MKTKIKEYLKLNKIDGMTICYIEDVLSDERLRDIAFRIGKTENDATEKFISEMKSEIYSLYPALSSDEKLSQQNMLNVSTGIFVADYWQLDLHDFFEENGNPKSCIEDSYCQSPKP